ncbi:acyloxyacyl hydrolase [Desulfuromonas sp.]|uniref:acyloxyacyl hydrolase n=1 Tax=Desulfuromonas sp. TaxID=892 RepID=UPI0025BCEB0C|nr:acyloxyacyl hydrolase [Desulfuromonas sp.]
MNRRWLTVLGCCLVAVLGCGPESSSAQTYARLGPLEVLGDGNSVLEFGVGEFDAFDGDEDAVAGFAEYRFGRKALFVGPGIGLMANADGAFFGYGSLYADLALGAWFFTPFTGAGLYEQGDSRDLGGIVQFRSGMTISRRIGDLYLLGVRYAHVSNANLYDDNPGEDELHLTWTVRF